MIPRLSQGLADLAGKLATAIAPDTASSYAMANSGMIAMLLAALSVESERAVATRMADVEELKALFEASGRDADPPGQGDRAAFLAREPASLRLSDVDRLHAEGLRLLIDLHAWAEVHDPALDRQIWDFLAAHTERHRLDAPG